MNNTFRGQKLTKGIIKELTTIITSKDNDFDIELGLNGSVKLLKDGWDLRFISEEENPSKASVIIDEGHKQALTWRCGNTRGTPNIIMDKGERLRGFIWLRQKGDLMLFCPNAHVTRQNINFIE